MDWTNDRNIYELTLESYPPVSAAFNEKTETMTTMAELTNISPRRATLLPVFKFPVDAVPGQCVTKICIRICIRKYKSKYSYMCLYLPFFVNPNKIVFVFALFFQTKPICFCIPLFCHPEYTFIWICQNNNKPNHRFLYSFFLIIINHAQ